MPIDIRGFKVIYGQRVLNALEVEPVFERDEDGAEHWKMGAANMPSRMTVVAVNADCNIVFIEDEASKFQFIPDKHDK